MATNPIQEIANEILAAINADYCYLGLVVTLSLPDICAALTCDPTNIHVSSDRFMNWVEENITNEAANKKYGLMITKEEFYGLRCGVLHNARMEHKKLANCKNIHFRLPSKTMMIGVMQYDTPDGTREMSFDLGFFSKAVINASLEWLEKNKDNPNVVANLPAVMQYRQNASHGTNTVVARVIAGGG